MSTRAPDDVYAMDGPVTWISAHRDGSYVYGLRMDVDHCACVSTAIELDFVPDFTWVIRSEPSQHYMDYHIPTAPAWPNLDPTTNSCYPQWILDNNSLGAANDNYGVIWIYDNNQGANPRLHFEDYQMSTVSDYTYPVTFTATIKVYTPSTWYAAAGSGSDHSVETTQTFRVTITEPCTQYDITYSSNFGTITTTVGTSNSASISFPSGG